MRKKIISAFLVSALLAQSPLLAQVTDVTASETGVLIGTTAGPSVVATPTEPPPPAQEAVVSSFPVSAADEVATTSDPLLTDPSVATPVTGVLGGVLGGEGLVPFRCPIEQIRTAYQNLVNPNDSLMALAIEKQTLAICRQSQEALIQIAENEMRLRELFEPIMAPPPETLPEPPIAQIVAPEPARNVTETLQIDLSVPISTPPEEGEVTAPSVEEQEASFTTDLVLGAIMRDPEGWKTILVRGEEMFTLREGEQVDEMIRVIRVGPTSVTLADPDGNEIVLE